MLLRRGAREVVAVDVGYGQLVWRLQTDERVQLHDRTNVRTLTPDAIGGPVGPDRRRPVVHLAHAWCCPPSPPARRPGADLVPMVKPQFEVGRERLGAGGVVRNLGIAPTRWPRSFGRLLYWGGAWPVWSPPRYPDPAAMWSSSCIFARTRPTDEAALSADRQSITEAVEKGAA